MRLVSGCDQTAPRLHVDHGLVACTVRQTGTVTFGQVFLVQALVFDEKHRFAAPDRGALGGGYRVKPSPSGGDAADTLNVAVNPELFEHLDQLIHHLVVVGRRRREAQALRATRHGWIVDGLDVDAVFFQQDV